MTTTTNKTADKFRKLAESMTAGIENMRRPLSQNPTPKRMREYKSRLHEADNAERCQKTLLALAVAHETESVPAIIAGIKTKAEVGALVSKGLESGGYYDCIPSRDFRYKTPQALAMQSLLANSHTDEDVLAMKDREHQHGIELMIDKLRFSDYPGFFPTPDALVQRMLDAADIKRGMLVLEPSAGIGNIADAIRTKHPDAELWCNEKIPCMVDILTAKGHNAQCSDFLTWVPEVRVYDRIVQNPPFERLADSDHVCKAYDLLSPHGRLVSIMSSSPFNNTVIKAVQFRRWMEDVNAEIHDLGSDAFKGVQAFRQTGVNAKFVVIHKQ